MYHEHMSWVIYAALSAFFAAVTAILAKIGIKGVNSNLATAIRTVVILVFAWSIVLFQGTHKEIGSISQYSLIFLILSGVATGLSWLFYFYALQQGPASQVAPIDKLSLVMTIILAALFLKEKVTAATLLGAALMTAGAIIISLAK
jgi:transporter family protein